MANNPYVNKVIYGNDTVMDISDTTATEGDVIGGKTFYKANGARATGTASLGVEWGDIGGVLGDQTDLADALGECEGRSYKLTRSALGYTPQNFIPDEYDFDETTVSGITFNAEKDGSITLNGIATADATVTIASNVPLGKANYTYKYYLNLQETDKSTGSVFDSNIILGINKSGASASVELNGVLEYTIPSAESGNYNITLTVKRGTNLSSGVYNVYPAILWDEPITTQLARTSKKTDSIVADISDGDYVPVYVTNSVAKGGAKITWENIKAKLKAFFDSIYPKEIEVLLKDTVGWVGKNLNNSKYVTETSNGVTFTANNNHSISVNGTATGGTAATSDDAENRFVASVTAQVILSGVLSSAPDGLEVFPWDYTINSRPYADSSQTTLQTNSVTASRPEISFYMIAGHTYYIRARLTQNKTANNVTIYPMIRDARIIDSTFEPYHESVEQTLRDAEVIEGKNKLHVINSANSYTHNGITYTVSRNSNGEVIEIDVNGTATANSNYLVGTHNNDYYIDLINQYKGTSTKFVLSKNTANVLVQFWSPTFANANNKPFSFPADVNTSNFNFAIHVDNGKTVNHEKVYPMLCTEEEWNKSNDFEPYYIPLKDSKFDRAEQRVLGAKNWFNAEGAYTKPSSASVTVSDKGKTIRIKADTASTYTNGKWVTNVEPNTDYTVTADVAITSGTASIKIEEASTSSTIVQSARITQSGKIELSFNSGSRTSVGLVLMSAYNTAEVSDVTFSNTLLRLASDPDDTYAPYAMTNRELTDAVKAVDAKIYCNWLPNGESVTVGEQIYNGGVVFVWKGTDNGQYCFDRTSIVSVIKAMTGITVVSNGYNNMVTNVTISNNMGAGVFVAVISG